MKTFLAFMTTVIINVFNFITKAIDFYATSCDISDALGNSIVSCKDFICATMIGLLLCVIFGTLLKGIKDTKKLEQEK